MKESISVLIVLSISLILLAHGQTPSTYHDTHLEKFVGELSILSRLVGGMSVQSKLATNLSTITTELVQFDLTQFSNVSTEPIVKTIETLLEESQKIGMESDFETITTAVHLLNDLVKNVVVFEKGLKENSMDDYEDKLKEFKKTIDKAGDDSVDPLEIEKFDSSNMKDVFECVDSELQPTELSWCYQLLKNAAETYDVNDTLKTSIAVQKMFDMEHYLIISTEAKHVFDKLMMINSYEMLFQNKKIWGSLESLLNKSNKDFKTIEGIVKKFDLKVSGALKSILDIPTKPTLKGSKTVGKLIPNGLQDLETLARDLKGEFIKETIARSEENLQKLMNGLQPLLKLTNKMVNTEKLLKEWKNSNNKESLVNVSKLASEMHKWKQLNIFAVDTKLITSIKTCFVNFPDLKGPFNHVELMHTKITVEKLHSLTSGFVGLQSAIKANSTLIYNGFEILLKVVRLHLKEMGSDDPKRRKLAFDKAVEELRLDPDYAEFKEFYGGLIKKYEYPSSAIITQAFVVDPKLDNLKDTVKEKDGKKVLKVIKCLSDEQFTADNLEVLLNGAKGLSRLAKNSSDVLNSVDYLKKISEIQNSFQVKQDRTRRRREANESSVEALNKFAHGTDGSIQIQAGEAAMEGFLAVQRNENAIKEVLKFESTASNDFYKRWKNVAKNKVELLADDVRKLEDYIDHHKSDGLYRMVDVMNEASKVKGVAFEWDGMEKFFKSLDPNQPEVEGNFTALKQIDLNFASKHADFQAAVMSLTVLQQFFDKFFDVKKTSEPRKSISLFTSETVAPTILLIVAIIVILIILAVIVFCLSPFGRRRLKRYYLQRNGTPEIFELYWRYSYWTDQESEKNELCEAVREGNCDLVKSLVSKGAYINVYNNFGNTPLHAATKYGQEEMVEVLIKNGADRKAYNYENKTPEQMLLDGASATTSRKNNSESMSTSGIVLPQVCRNIELIYAKYRYKEFRQRIPDLLPTMMFHIRIDGRIKKNAAKLFIKKFRGNVTDLMTGVTHLVLPTDTKGVFSSDVFSHIMCVFLPTILMQEQWMRACLEKKSNFRDDYKFRVEKVWYKGKEYGTVLKWARWIHKQTLPYLFGVQLHVCADVGEAVASQMKQLVEMHGATWCQEMPVKEDYNLGSHPYHHCHLGPLFVIHSNNVPLIDQLSKDEMYTLMTFDGFVEFMLEMKVRYDPQRRPTIPVKALAIDGPSESECPTNSRFSVVSEMGPASVASQKM